MSMVLRDNSFLNITKSEWDSAVDPNIKVSNAINEAVDFFVLFSSLIGIIG
jgi:hypothetical protein